jgi:hypothetical protein
MLRMPSLRANWPLAAAVTGLFWYSAAAAELPREVDLTVSGVQLNDSSSARLPFGAQVQLDDPDSDRPKAFICNADRTEKLTLVYYEGDTSYIISEFQVERVETRYVDCMQPPMQIDRFVSGKGIQLGMTRNDVTHIFGKDYNEQPQLDEVVISYRIDNKNESGFLQNNSAPAYYGQYHFKEDKLVRFSFGFEFP